MNKDLTKILHSLKPVEDSFKSYLNTDDALFHYTTLPKALGHILSSKLFKLSTYGKTNDPKEYKDIIFGIDWNFSNDKKTYSIEYAQANINSIRYNLKAMYLCSNRSDNNQNHLNLFGWNKSRMWSEHGENHSGICMVFSKSKLENYIKNEFNNEYYKFDFIKYTKYDNKFRKAEHIDSVKLEQMNNSESYSLYHVKKHIEYFCFQKNVDYRDESEYRVIIYNNSNNDIYFDITKFIEGIIVGEKATKDSYPLITQMCEELNIQCRRMFYNKNQMHLLNL